MDDILSNLNPAQKEAVTHHGGPLLLVAGAGTGKTRVLTHRVIHLIESEVVKPEEILALTFTEKATEEMQERLDVLLPYGYTELWVKTFHGFCDAVLRERGLEMGLDTAYQILTQTDLALFLKDHLFSFDLNYYRPLGNPLRFVGALAGHFGHLRDEMVVPEVYVKFAKKALKAAKDDSEKEAAEKQLELAYAYSHYDELLLKNGVLDFASLTYLTLHLFEQHPSVLREYQDRFKYILVDEFQDTNTAQNRLVELLASKHKNVMVVGDDDQCIYKWRGASLTNILQFEKRFPEAKKVVLTQNYRSTQPILDMAYSVIQHNNPFRLEDREKIDKKLIREGAKGAAKPSVVHFENYLDEVEFVVKQIGERAKNEEVSYRDCAILVRAAAHATPFLDALNRAGIPYYFSGAQGLYQRAEIKDLLALLRALANPYDDIALFRCLSMKVFGFEMGYLLTLLQKAKSSSTPLLQVLKSTKSAPDLFNEGASLRDFMELFERLRTSSKDQPTSHLLGIFLKDSGYLKALESNDSPENVEALQNLATFSQIIKSFEESHNAPRLVEALEYLRTRQDMGDRVSPSDEELDTDTVKVLTVHAAKGLEFDTVFLVDLVQQRFPSTNRRDPFELPEELLLEVADQDATHLHEERRLFYVAATRAKNHLFLTYSDYYDGKKRWKRSIFIDEALESGMAEEGKSVVHVAATDDPEDKPVVFSYERSHRPLRLSFSRINTFQMCPLKYKFQYLYQIAEPLSHQLSFGSSVHNTLNSFYQEIKKGHSPSMNRLKELYEKHWIPLGYTSRAHHNKRKEKGWETLEQFYKTNSKKWVIPEHIERPFTLKIPSGLTVTGRIDRIDRLPDGTFEVIDYKTGSMKDQKDADKNLQLSIYALACQNIYKVPVSKLSLYYLEDNQKISTTRSTDQLTATETELETIAKTMASSDFAATPSPFLCKFCEYRLICDKAAA